MNIGLEVVAAASVFISAIVFHELGHWLILKEFYKGATVEFNNGTLRTYVKGKYASLRVGELPPGQKNPVLISGIAAGMVPVFAYLSFTEWPVMVLGVGVLYLVGIIPDLRLLWRRA